MIMGFHVIWGAYGFWLPNDPRGSWSEYVGSHELLRFGNATKTASRHSVAHARHDHDLRLAAKEALKYPAVRFTGLQARAIGRGFAESVGRGKVVVWACSILPDHVHLVIARHTCAIEQIVNLLKGAATRSLLAEGLHPFGDQKVRVTKVPGCWAVGQWKVFLDSGDDVNRAIRYVENNPIKEGLPRQSWPFVTPFVQPLVLGERSPEARG